MGYGLGIGACALFFESLSGLPAFENFALLWQVLVGTGVVVALIILISVMASLLKVFRVDPAIVFRG